MAFPNIPTVGGGRVLTANQLNTTATRTFPAMSGLTKNAGDLLIAIIVAYQTSTGTDAAFSGWSDGFTEFHDSATSTTLAMGMAYKWSNGTETAAPTVTQAGTITGDASMILLSIPGAHASTPPEAGARVSGTTGAADPASFNPAGWGTEDTLWISVVGSGLTNITGSWTGTGTTAPTNYTDRVDTNASDTSTVGDCEAAVAFRQLNAASEDVGTAGVDVTNARNGAVVIAVRPAPDRGLEDDSSSWQGVLASVAVAASLAISAATTANVIEQATKQQQDEVASISTVAEDPFIQHQVVDESRVFYVADSDEQIVPQPATPALEESEWLPQPVPEPLVVQWTQPWNDEIVQQPAALGIDEDYYDVAISFEDVIHFTFFGEEGNLEATAGGTLGIDEEGYSPRVVIQPDVFLVESFSIGTSALSFDETEWRPGIVDRPAPTLRVWYGDEEIATPFVPLGVDDSDWAIPQPAAVPPTLQLWFGDEERITVPSPLGVDEEGYVPYVVVRPRAFLAESFSFETSALVVEESDWQAPVIQPVAPTIQLWYGDAEIVPQPAAPQIVEDYWTPPHVVAARVWAEAISTDVEIVSTPLPVEETELPWSAQFWVPAPTMGLYLPDPDTWPGGVFAPPVSRLRYDIRTGLWVMILNDKIAISL